MSEQARGTLTSTDRVLFAAECSDSNVQMLLAMDVSSARQRGRKGIQRCRVTAYALICSIRYIHTTSLYTLTSARSV